jgi:hypothetical protein
MLDGSSTASTSSGPCSPYASATSAAATGAAAPRETSMPPGAIAYLALATPSAEPVKDLRKSRADREIHNVVPDCRREPVNHGNPACGASPGATSDGFGHSEDRIVFE